MFGRFGSQYGQIFREGQPISAQQFNEELGRCITDLQVAEGSGLTLSRFGRRVIISTRRGDNTGDGVFAKISSATSVTASSEWAYSTIIQRVGGSSSDGLEDDGATTYPAKNLWETRFSMAGYENASVTGVYQIPTGAIVRAWWGKVSGTATLLFCERNEPTCD